MTSPAVSVVMPAYRHERYVGQAIESMLAQTLEDWELIVIDDGSPDATWQAIRSFEDPRILPFRHEANRGAHATINAGVARARGRYLAILNSDDVYHPDRLRRALAFLEEGTADLVGTDIDLIDGDGRVVERDHPWLDWFERRRKSLHECGDVVEALLAGNLFVTTSNLVLRRAACDQIGEFVDFRYAHDYEFLLKAALGAGLRLAFLEGEKLLLYRMHGDNTVLESFLQVHRETFSLLCTWVPRAFPQRDRARGDTALRHIQDIESLIEFELDERIARLRDELAERDNTIRVMTRSRSWRITAPLRAATRLLGASRPSS